MSTANEGTSTERNNTQRGQLWAVLVTLAAIVVWLAVVYPKWKDSSDSLTRLRYQHSVEVEERHAGYEAERLRWEAWVKSNCAVQGSRLMSSSQEVLLYSCEDGTSWESLGGLPPQHWSALHPAEGVATPAAAGEKPE